MKPPTPLLKLPKEDMIPAKVEFTHSTKVTGMDRESNRSTSATAMESRSEFAAVKLAAGPNGPSPLITVLLSVRCIPETTSRLGTAAAPVLGSSSGAQNTSPSSNEGMEDHGRA